MRSFAGAIVCIVACATASGDVLDGFGVVYRTGTPLQDLGGQSASNIDSFTVSPDGGISLNLSWGTIPAWSGIFRLDGGQPRLVAMNGTQAPGCSPGQVFTYFSSLGATAIDTGSGTVFGSFLSGPGVTETNGSGIWASTGFNPSLVVRRGSVAPEAGPTATIGEFSRLWPAGPGAVVCATRLVDQGRPNAGDSALWWFSGSSRALLARYGDQAPGLAPGYRFSYLFPGGSSQPAVVSSSRNDLCAFTAVCDGPGGIGAAGIWATSPTSEVRLIAVDQQTGLTNLDPRITLWLPSRLAINESGAAAFRGFLWSAAGRPVVTDYTDTGVFRTDLTAQEPRFTALCREGDAIPGRNLPYGIAVFSGSSSDNNKFSDPQINAAGHVAFTAGLEGPHGSGVFFHDGNSLRTLVLSVDPVPDRPGLLFGLPLGPLALNEFDDVAFLASSTGPGYGLYAVPAGGVLRAVALPGDQVLLAPGVVKTIDRLFWGSGTWSIQLPMFGAARNLYFTAVFTDGSAAVLSSQIPAPGGLGIGTIGAALCVRRRKRSCG